MEHVLERGVDVLRAADDRGEEIPERVLRVLQHLDLIGRELALDRGVRPKLLLDLQHPDVVVVGDSERELRLQLRVHRRGLCLLQPEKLVVRRGFAQRPVALRIVDGREPVRVRVLNLGDLVGALL